MPEGEPKKGEENQGSERTSGVMKVGNISTGAEKGILDNIKIEIFDKQNFDNAEIEKTPEEIEIINGILTNLPAFVKKYGGIPLPLKPEHVHIIDPHKLKSGIFEKLNGFYSFELQAVFISGALSRKDNHRFANTLAHELMHFSGFQSINFNSEDKTLRRRVGGLSVMIKDNDKNSSYFHAINEAVTTELEKRFGEEYFKSIPPLADEEYEKSKAMEDFFSEETINSYTNTDLTMLCTEEYSYSNEREKLIEILAEIRQKDPEQFESQEDVFKIFAEAYFTGKILKLARLIEKTYGKGSFRKLGAETESKTKR